MLHILAVTGFFVELAVQLCNWLSLTLAEIAHSVQHILGGQMVANNFTIIADIDHIEGVQTVLVIDIDGDVYLTHRTTMSEYYDSYGDKIKGIKEWMLLPRQNRWEKATKESEDKE